MEFIKNPDKTKYRHITKAVEANGGYCPCLIFKTEDTKCPCKEFRTQTPTGEFCRCGRFKKNDE